MSDKPKDLPEPFASMQRCGAVLDGTAEHCPCETVDFTPEAPTRTPDRIKDAWAEVDALAIEAGVDGKKWIAAVAQFWWVAGLASETIPPLSVRGDKSDG